MFTDEGRIVLSPSQEELLAAYAEAFSKLVRELWRRCVRGGEVFEKSGVAGVSQEMQARGWSSHQVRSAFHAAQDAQRTAEATAAWLLENLRDRLAAAERRLAKEKKASRRHGRARRRDRLRSSLARLEADIAAGRISPSWGGRKLFSQQHEVGKPSAAHGSHEEWLADWRAARDMAMFFEGAQDASFGNYSAKLHLDPAGPDRGIDILRLQVPTFLRHLIDGRDWVAFEVRGFRHGREHVEAAQRKDYDLFERRKLERAEKGLPPAVKPKVPLAGPVTIRIHHRANSTSKRRRAGWYVGASVARHAAPAVRTDRRLGAVGLDVNADHLAVCHIDASGNPVAWRRIPWDLTGTSAQRANQIGEAVAQACDWAAELGVPVAVEKLDFERKKAELRSLPRHLRRGLSSFAYSQILERVECACVDRGVERLPVPSAFTSVLGQANYAGTHGVSVDLAAACVIARRGLGLRERVRPTVARRGPARSLPAQTNSRDRRTARVAWLRSLARDVLPPRRHTHGSEWLTRSGLNRSSGAPPDTDWDPFVPDDSVERPLACASTRVPRAAAPRAVPAVGTAERPHHHQVERVLATSTR